MEDVSRPFGLNGLNEKQHFESILESSGIGIWEIDFLNDVVYLSDTSKFLLAYPVDKHLTYNTFLALFNPTDALDFETSSNANSGRNHSFSMPLRTLTDSDSDHALICRGDVLFNANGKPLSVAGTFISLRRQNDENAVLPIKNKEIEDFDDAEKFKILAEQSPIAAALVSVPNLTIEFANKKMFDLWDRDGSIIGQSLSEVQPEIIYQYAKQDLLDIVHTGEPYLQDGIKIFSNENRVNKENYYDFTYSPVLNKGGRVTGIMINAVDVTKRLQTQKKLEVSEQKFRSLIEEVPVGISVFTGKDMIVELANEPMISYWAKDASVIGKPLREAFPELIGQPFLQILDDVLTKGETFSTTNTAVDIIVDGELRTYYFNITYKPLFNDDGKVFAIIDMSLDVTPEVLAQKALVESEARLRSVIDSAPAAMGLFVGRDLVIEMPNQSFIDIVGKGPAIAGKPLREVMPELENQAFLQILDDVFTSGKMYQSFGTQVDIVQNGLMTHNFYNITYTPIFDNDGKVYAILDIAIDVTERVIAQKEVEQSQIQLLELFEQSPVAIAMISKDNLVFKMANPFYAEMVGRLPEELVGKSLLEAMPELEGQGFDILINAVTSTGKPFIAPEQPVNVARNGKMEKIYVDLCYQPQRDMEGKISGVLVVATDVTQQVISRRNIEEAENALRGAIELADLGTWQIDFINCTFDFSPRLRQWFGIGEDEDITYERIYIPVSPFDRGRVQDEFDKALSPGSDGLFDLEYTLYTGGCERIVHAQGKVFKNDEGRPSKITGTVQDVTIQRQVKLALELQVQERTEELATMNEELAAINEEYVSINEELSESNNLLIQSNENLQQFAYVASHDLQEPLRKIQSFGNIITSRYAAELGDGVNYLQRMQTAAKRMSNLIEDLLMFSRISSKSDRIELVNLNGIMKSVLTDLELLIQESEAVINMDELPEILGDRSQLGQLFQNLLSNALKFRKNDVTPEINITAKLISGMDLPPAFAPARATKMFVKIGISDNGIGFDETYAERIFQLFQRLHGRSEYSGTGIGLAICEKVAVNHGGTILVESKVQEGSTFSVLLPMPS
ncbi:PAS domain-containing protein [Dyadobacter sp. CY345]|uniref:PAS domain-containing protein n=1 Tax=Dyadobacter sp. CY345 TaxID=2909335 RepID=UPI001F1A6B84|nr:PAS domain-containing protein [Dyadobacter sp. CY345]MCF2446574.1 PAS domain-containing protein [Dyadobacter sp. CY345]